MVDIYKFNGELRAIIHPDDNSQNTRKIMGEDIIDLSFSYPSSIPFTIGDYLIYDGIKYTLNQLPAVQKQSDANFTYTMTLEHPYMELSKVLLLGYDGQNNMTIPDPGPIMGDATLLLSLVIANINRAYPGQGWQLGTVAETVTKSVTFSNDNCYSALVKLASSEGFDNEFFFSGSDGKTINFYRDDAALNLTFEYGRGKGLYNISRSNVDATNVITRLYLSGSERNISSDYMGGRPRLSPNGNGFIQSANVIKYGIIEGAKQFDDIYPKYEGTVTQTGNDVYTFSDSGIDFDVNAQLMPGVTAKLTFNTGQLAGYSFEIGRYTHATHTFTINRNQDEKALVLPSSIIGFSAGDKYVITDIEMPASYVANAEAKLTEEGTRYLSENDEPRVNYAVNCDPQWFKLTGAEIELGKQVTIKDSSLNLDRLIRITGYRRKINNQYDYNLDLAEVIAPQLIARVISEITKTNNIVKLGKLSDPARMRLNWRTSEELRSNIYDPEGYYFTDKIKPLSIETTMLSVGARSQQFTLRNILFNPNAGGDVNKFESSAGQLVHFNIDPTGPRSWNITGTSISGLSPTTVYYIYARAEINSDNATIILDTNARVYNDTPGFYFFLVGILHSVFSGFRALSPTYGQTYINGRNINTGRITSQDGGSYFDLDSGTISGRIQFEAGSTGYANILDAPPPGTAIFTEQPTTPYSKGDYWNNNGVMYVATVGRTSGPFVSNDWVVALIYDSTKTVIDGGLITSGNVLLGNGNGINAGITGDGTSGSDIRFFAGAPYGQRASAPFRVNQNGEAVMMNASIQGYVNAISGKVGNWAISSGGLFNDSDSAYVIVRKLQNGLVNEARIGPNIFPEYAGVKGTAYFECSIPNSADNVALWCKSSGGTGRSYAAILEGDVLVKVGGLFLEGDLIIQKDCDVKVTTTSGTQTYDGFTGTKTAANGGSIVFVKGLCVG